MLIPTEILFALDIYNWALTPFLELWNDFFFLLLLVLLTTEVYLHGDFIPKAYILSHLIIIFLLSSMIGFN